MLNEGDNDILKFSTCYILEMSAEHGVKKARRRLDPVETRIAKLKTRVDRLESQAQKQKRWIAQLESKIKKL